MNNLYALIMAGGGGTRLWPLSRQKRPKQMLALTDERTMFQLSVDRLAPLLPPERILVITGSEQVAELHRSVPHIPAENFIAEPFGQNTGPAVGLATAHIQHRDPQAMIAVLTADHHIADTEKFCRVLTAASSLAAQNYIVTLGIEPSFPATGYGYIQRGDPIAQLGEFQTYHAAGFTEKPDRDTAVRFLATGLYSWNSGMFIYSVKHIMREYERQQPTMYALVQEIKAALAQNDYPVVLARNWPQMPRLSIDYAIMEGAENMAVIPVNMGWNDIGSWATLFDVLTGDQAGNVTRGKAQAPLHLDTHNTLVISDRRVATIGLQNMVIVDTDDVLLICQRDRSEDVRQLIEQLKTAGEDDLL